MKLEDFIAGIYRQQYKYKSFLPSPINEKWLWDSSELNIMLEKANIALSRLNSLSAVIPNIDLLVSMYTNREAIFSTRIEGTKTEMDDLFNNSIESDEEKRNDKQEVKNYIEAINYAVERLKDLPISNRLLKETHAILMKGVRGENKYPGEFRVTQNWIGGSSLTDAFYIPPHQNDIIDSMNDLEMFIHNEDTPNLIRIAMIHYQFETIHPFCDGNGRLGRLLIILYLINFKLLNRPILYISAFFEKHRDTYYDYLTNVRKNNDIILWILFFLNGIIETSEETMLKLNKIVKLRDEVIDRINREKRNSNYLKLIDYLFKKPIINAKEINIFLNTTNKTGYNIIDKLERLHILKQMNEDNRRNKIYKFEEYLNIFR